MDKWEGPCQNGFQPNCGFLPKLANFELLPFTTAQGMQDRTIILNKVCSKSSHTYKWGPKEPHPPQPWKKGEWNVKPSHRGDRKLASLDPLLYDSNMKYHLRIHSHKKVFCRVHGLNSYYLYGPKTLSGKLNLT